MKKKISREEVSNLLITDKFFSKGRTGLKIWQTFIALLGWAGVLLPFAWLLFPIFLPEFAEGRRLVDYASVDSYFLFILFFLAIVFILRVVSYLYLTLMNNRQFKHSLQKETLHDEVKLDKRKQLLEQEYTDRFGDKAFRESVRYYSVKPEQNLDKDFVRDLYKDGGVEL
ncbi:hypothetical protein NRIC_30480 [Enterococcus florum]|uniref:Cell division protein n=1 Tax=Enterococcus florum TaxID=2480627 RepID=A0A4P5PAN2_9ENTE|nr:hypothetical protein [Enterococcus florum]GCF95157.1 hypothetical protein NRIC_30480 [Enterococcus florum]